LVPVPPRFAHWLTGITFKCVNGTLGWTRLLCRHRRQADRGEMVSDCVADHRVVTCYVH
jgi:hypothetical protein